MGSSLVLRKRLRGLVKRLLPYGVQSAYAFRTYGIYFPSCRTWPGVLGWLQKAAFAALPFGLVCWIKRFDPDRGVNGGAPASRRAPEPSFRIPRAKRRRIERARVEGLRACGEVVRRHASARIAVVLHLFYDRSWDAIRTYLNNLEPYGFDLYVTVTEGRISERTLASVRAFRPDATIRTCANRGFDLWPFVSILNEFDLTAYDIVFKLHSKGTGRPSLFMYGQVFKYADWFFNLYDGVLGGLQVHRVVQALMEEGALLAAAANLLVADPPHKRAFVRRFCEARGIPFVEGYRFVAGTCFAVRGEVLKPLRDMGLGEADFAPSARGEFSTAHAVERTVCFPACGRMAGTEVVRNEYPREAAEYGQLSALRLLDDPRFRLDDDFVYRRLETCMVQGYDVVPMKLGDIRRMRHDGTVCTLAECEPFDYLRNGDGPAYDAYCRMNRELSGFRMSRARFENLRRDMERYDPRCMPVVRREGNILMDGQHRCCVLLDRFGPDHEIEVLRLW